MNECTNEAIYILEEVKKLEDVTEIYLLGHLWGGNCRKILLLCLMT